MKLKELLIVGIDPGTTTAYALLDLNGNLLDVNSSKNYDLGTLIKVIAEKGLPLIVGCDKKNVPWFVQDFATKTGAKVISPEEDLKVAEKKDIARLFKGKAETRTKMMQLPLHYLLSGGKGLYLRRYTIH